MDLARQTLQALPKLQVLALEGDQRRPLPAGKIVEPGVDGDHLQLCASVHRVVLDRLDRAVWAAYGWLADETPADAPEETILARLLALNGKRSG